MNVLVAHMAASKRIVRHFLDFADVRWPWPFELNVGMPVILTLQNVYTIWFFYYALLLIGFNHASIETEK